MTVINLFAESGAGKSTTAAGLFFLMKRAGYNVEFATEYAKQLVWEERFKDFSDQLYITAKQNHKLHVLKHKVDYVITDSPLLLGLVYQENSPENFYLKAMILKLFGSYQNINFLLKRSKEYKQLGRNETEAEAADVRERLVKLMDTIKLPYTSLDANDNAPENIFKHLGLDK